MAEFRITRQKLLERSGGVCTPGLAYHDRLCAEQGHGLEDTVYPDGWTSEVAKAVYDENPRFLRWLERADIHPGALVPTVDFDADPDHPLLNGPTRQHFASRMRKR